MAEEIVVTSLYDEDLKPLASIALKRGVWPKETVLEKMAQEIVFAHEDCSDTQTHWARRAAERALEVLLEEK